MPVILPGGDGISLGSLDCGGGSQGSGRTSSENVTAYSLQTKGVSLVVSETYHRDRTESQPELYSTRLGSDGVGSRVKPP